MAGFLFNNLVSILKNFSDGSTTPSLSILKNLGDRFRLETLHVLKIV
jgi:hypothetical protein